MDLRNPLLTICLAALPLTALADRATLLAGLRSAQVGIQHTRFNFEDGEPNTSRLDAGVTGVAAAMVLTPRFLGLNLYLNPRFAYQGGGDSNLQGGLGAGLSFLVNGSLVITPHADIDGQRLQVSGPGGDRTYSHLGYGGGLRIDWTPAPRWLVTLDGTVQRMGFSEVDRPIPLEFGGGDITLGLDNEWSFRTSVQASWLINPRLGMLFRYGYSRTEYGASNLNSLVSEPGKTVTGNAFMAGIQIAFE